MDVFYDWKWWLIRKYNTVWDKINPDIKEKFDYEPVYKKKKLKTKIKSHVDEVRDFYDKQISKVDYNTCLAVISLDSVLEKDENYYPQLILKDCK